MVFIRFSLVVLRMLFYFIFLSSVLIIIVLVLKICFGRVLSFGFEVVKLGYLMCFYLVLCLLILCLIILILSVLILDFYRRDLWCWVDLLVVFWYRNNWLNLRYGLIILEMWMCWWGCLNKLKMNLISGMVFLINLLKKWFLVFGSFCLGWRIMLILGLWMWLLRWFIWI